MAGESKQDSRIKQGAKKKGKMVLAKDPKELGIAIVVFIVFIANGIYQVVKYLKEQSPAPTPAQASSTTHAANAVAQTASSSSSPMIGIILGALVVIGIIGFVAYKFLMSGGASSKNSPSTSGKKGKMVLAKSPKELAIAVVVFLVFIGNGIYQVVKYMQEQAPAPTQSSTTHAANTVAQTASSSSSPMVGIIIGALVVIGLIGFAAYKFLMSGASSGGSSGGTSGGSSGNAGSSKKSPSASGKKGKFMLAKDPKELGIAAVVVLLFLGNGLYMIIKYFQEQGAQPVAQSTQQSQNSMQEPGKNPEDMNNPNAVNPNDPNQAQTPQGGNSDIYSQTMNGQQGQNGQQTGLPGDMSAQQANGDVSIIPRKAIKKSGKMVLISVDSSGRSNPFLPAAENSVPHKKLSKLPSLPLPPETALTNSDASKIMDTTISGILYDKYSPSAIINIGGTDYLVKQGDIINRYKILSITKTQVLVQLGKNVYEAGVGELLSQTNLNYNTIANLNKKFGGNVRKKGY